MWISCWDVITGEWVSADIVAWTAAVPVSFVPPEVLARRARSELVMPTPSIRTWPSPANAVVNVPTWLHVDNFVAGSRSAVAGGVTATVRAEPVSVTWAMGDGATVACTGAGEVFSDGAQGSDCTHTFSHSSAREPGLAFHGTTSITWHLSWTSNVGAGGDLGNVTTTSAVSWHVEQIQSVITKEGSR